MDLCCCIWPTKQIDVLPCSFSLYLSPQTAVERTETQFFLTDEAQADKFMCFVFHKRRTVMCVRETHCDFAG